MGTALERSMGAQIAHGTLLVKTPTKRTAAISVLCVSCRSLAGIMEALEDDQ